MKLRSVVIIAVVLAALTTASCWWLTTRDEAVPGRGQSDGPGLLAATPAHAACDDPAGAPARESALEDGNAQGHEEEPPSPYDLRGTFVIVDHNGVEHTTESGEVEVEIDGCSTGFEVTSGAWRMPDFTSRSRMRVVEATLGSKPVVCDIDVALDPSNLPLLLRGRWLAPVHLRVVGSDTGLDLANIRLVELNFRECLYDRRHPAARESDASVVASTPVLLWPTPGSMRQYFVGAARYAWAHLEVDPEASGERWVRLDRGGDVDVVIDGRRRGGSLRLSRTEDGRPLAEWSLDEGAVTHLADLPQGEWHIAVAVGHWFQQPLVLGRARVTVTPGTVATTAITLRDDFAPPRSAILAGTLVYPSGWRKPPRIDIEPTGATRHWESATWLVPERVANRTDEYRWSAGRKDAGSYQARVTGSGFLTRFDLPPSGDERVRIVVPEPCDIRLRVLDAETGRVFAIKDEHGCPPVWELTDAGWDGSGSFERLELQPDGSWVGQAPPGVIRIYVRADGYQASDTRHEVVRGANEYVVSVVRDCGVEITLRDGDVTVPWPAELVASLHDASGRRMNLYESYSVARVAARAAGELTLTIPDVTGFEPIPPRAVNIGHATWTKMVIPLQRTR